ncbi:MAG: insulinase family protein [Acidobacteria bacterium]|nr:MAG: insulinase family protein [Acidobacteriota bacterium]
MRSSVLARVIPAIAVALALAAPAAAAPVADVEQGPVSRTGDEIDIPFTKFVLDNGLTLVVHEDHKAPIVAVNVWYHVGSKDEKPGKTGFAHLFEHLMFNGTENYNDDYMKPFDRVGGTEMNGTTNVDRTNYFQNVPSTALDLALWMESDRMGHLLGAIDQAKLDEQRGVVQNEKRQGENQPYGRMWGIIAENTYPAGHPYSWTTIGSMEDLNAASLEDVHEWFKRYYGAANAVLVIAGDVDAETVRQKVEHYFGDIAPGPPLTRQEAWVAKRSGSHRATMQDRVSQARVVKVWNTPPWGALEDDYLDLVGLILGSGKTSRLYKRLVYDDQIASDVVAFNASRELGSQMIIWATALPGQDLATVERALDEELARFLAEGPTEREVERAKAEFRSRFVRGIERIGGFGGKSDVLAQNEVYGGRPDFYKTTLSRRAAATAEDLQRAAVKWLSDGVFTLEIHPVPPFKSAAQGADRSRLPEVGDSPDVSFPSLQRATLDNGLEIVLAERHAVPLVQLSLIVDAGYAADQGAIPGTANLAMNMLDEGTTSRSALEISEELQLLGATLFAGSSLDTSSVTLSALRGNLGPSLDLFADVILNPAFPEADFERLKRQQLASIQREKTSPFQMALRVFPVLIYGPDHAYSVPFTGSGTEDSVGRLTRQNLIDFHRTWFKPQNATLVVVGDVTMEEIRSQIEARFGSWQPGEVPRKNVGSVAVQGGNKLYLIDRPDSIQSVIVAGHLAPPKGDPDEIAIEAMNQLLGGSFTARINMNLREDKHWSYGASSFILDARGPRPFLVLAPVQTDKTKESIEELRKELTGIIGDRPPAPEEVAKAKDQQTLTLPGRWETLGAVASSIAEMIGFGLPEDYWQRYPDLVRSLDREQVAAAARKVVHPDELVWVVVGDRAKIEPGLRQLGFADIQLIDADGKPVDAPSPATVGAASE